MLKIMMLALATFLSLPVLAGNSNAYFGFRTGNPVHTRTNPNSSLSERIRIHHTNAIANERARWNAYKENVGPSANWYNYRNAQMRAGISSSWSGPRH